MKDTDLMPFGKHKGTEMANVPATYLLWLWDNDRMTPVVEKYIEANLELLEAEAEKLNSIHNTKK
jgi:uncharacterized protein (DUF3820 family)